jgi:hypothetical protein
VAALENAKAGDKLLLVGYGDGADAFAIEVAPGIEKLRDRRGVRWHLKRRAELPSYDMYMRFRQLLATEHDERNASISPDGKWMVFESDLSGGRYEIFVRPFPDVDAGQFPVSTGGGSKPLWSPAGGEIFYVSTENKLMSVRVDTTRGFSAEKPVVLFDAKKGSGLKAEKTEKGVVLRDGFKRLLWLAQALRQPLLVVVAQERLQHVAVSFQAVGPPVVSHLALRLFDVRNLPRQHAGEHVRLPQAFHCDLF